MTKRFFKGNGMAVYPAAALCGLVLALFLGGCDNPAGGGSAAEKAADDFKAGQSAVLDKTADTVGLGDEEAVDAALAAYEELSDKAKELLAAEKTKLDGLKAKIAELKALADAPKPVTALSLDSLVTAPVKDAAPVTTAVDETQYTGTVAWRNDGGAAFEEAAFAASAVYQAVVALTAKEGWTFTGVAADSFTYTGAASISNAADSGTVTIVFPATEAGKYVFTTPAEYRTLVQVNTGNLVITGSGTAGVFVNNRTVTLTPYKIAKYETTWQLWKEVYDWAVSADRGAGIYAFANPGQEGGGTGGTPGPNQPVAKINWRDAVVWCNAYSELSGLTPVYYTDAACTTVLRASSNDAGTATAADTAVIKAGANGYRLPTEAQWECAARGGDPADTTNWAYTYAGGNTAADVAVYNPGNSPSAASAAVGSKTANRLGLFDMSGNMREWVWDWKANIAAGEVTDPPGPDTGTTRGAKGGRYNTTSASQLAVYYRTLAFSPDGSDGAGGIVVENGFRLARAGNE